MDTLLNSIEILFNESFILYSYVFMYDIMELLANIDY